MQTNILLDAANHWAAQQAEAIRIARAQMEADFPTMFPAFDPGQFPAEGEPLTAAEVEAQRVKWSKRLTRYQSGPGMTEGNLHGNPYDVKG